MLEQSRSCRSDLALAFIGFIHSNGNLQLRLARKPGSHLGRRSVGEKQ